MPARNEGRIESPIAMLKIKIKLKNPYSSSEISFGSFVNI